MPHRYREVVVGGPRGRGLGFLEGFFAGRGHGKSLLDAEEEGFDCQTLREQLREILHPKAEWFHVLVPDDRLALVREAVEAAASRHLPLEIHQTRAVSGARFSFSCSVYSREHGQRIRGGFERLPEGVSLQPEQPFEEIIRPGSKGIAVYAPDHQYELRGHGDVTGPLEGVLAVHRFCRDEALIRSSRIESVFESEIP